MSIVRNLKRFFLKEKKPITPVQLRGVTNEELLGRLQRGMSLEHITCDEYIPVPTDKRGSIVRVFSPDLLKEAIENTKAVREIAKINTKLAMDEAFWNNRKYVLNNTTKPVILPPKIKDEKSGLEMDDFDLNKIFAQRRVKVYDNEKWP